MFKIIGADQKQYGPISTEQIRQWIRDGRLNAQTPAQREGSTEWQQISAYPEFVDIFQITPAAATDDATPAGYAPAPMPGATSTGSYEAALSAIKGPAIALIVVASIGIAYYLFTTVFVLAGGGPMAHRPLPPNIPPGVQRFIEWMQDPRAGLFNLVFVVGNAFLLFGAIKMLKLQSRTLAIITCIVALVPCGGCCCIFALPFGIWGLVVLNKPEVKSQFKS